MEHKSVEDLVFTPLQLQIQKYERFGSVDESKAVKVGLDATMFIKNIERYPRL